MMGIHTSPLTGRVGIPKDEQLIGLMPLNIVPHVVLVGKQELVLPYSVLVQPIRRDNVAFRVDALVITQSQRPVVVRSV